jgi:hypothetical protein
MREQIENLLKQSVKEETKQEKWALAASLALIRKDSRDDLVSPEFYAIFGMEFAENLARQIVEDSIPVNPDHDHDDSNIIYITERT